MSYVKACHWLRMSRRYTGKTKVLSTTVEVMVPLKSGSRMWKIPLNFHQQALYRTINFHIHSVMSLLLYTTCADLEFILCKSSVMVNF